MESQLAYNVVLQASVHPSATPFPPMAVQKVTNKIQIEFARMWVGVTDRPVVTHRLFTPLWLISWPHWTHHTQKLPSLRLENHRDVMSRQSTAKRHLFTFCISLQPETSGVYRACSFFDCVSVCGGKYNSDRDFSVPCQGDFNIFCHPITNCGCILIVFHC